MVRPAGRRAAPDGDGARVVGPGLDQVVEGLVRRVAGHQDALGLAHQLGQRRGVLELVLAAEGVGRAHHPEPGRHHRVLVAGLADQVGHRRGAAGPDHVVDGERAAGDVGVLHHLHGRAARLVVAATGAVGDDHQQVAAVVAAGHPAARRGRPPRRWPDASELSRRRRIALILSVTEVTVERQPTGWSCRSPVLVVGWGRERPRPRPAAPLRRRAPRRRSGWRCPQAGEVTVTTASPRRPGPHLRRARAPLRTGHPRRPRAGHEVPLHRARRRGGRLAAGGLALPALGDPHARRRRSPCGSRSGRAARRCRTTRPATPRTGSTRCAPTPCGWPASPTAATPTTRTPAPRCAGRTWCCSWATRSTPTTPPRRCGSSSRRAATSTRSRAPSSRTTRSTPSSTGWRGPTPRTAGCSPPCPAR